MANHHLDTWGRFLKKITKLRRLMIKIKDYVGTVIFKNRWVIKNIPERKLSLNNNEKTPKNVCSKE